MSKEIRTFIVAYNCLGSDYEVKVQARDLNSAMLWFAKYYHQIEEVYSIKEV